MKKISIVLLTIILGACSSKPDYMVAYSDSSGIVIVTETGLYSDKAVTGDAEIHCQEYGLHARLLDKSVQTAYTGRTFGCYSPTR